MMLLEHVILGRVLMIWVGWEASRSSSGGAFFSRSLAVSFLGAAVKAAQRRGSPLFLSLTGSSTPVFSTNCAPQLVLCLGKDGLHPLLKRSLLSELLPRFVPGQANCRTPDRSLLLRFGLNGSLVEQTGQQSPFWRLESAWVWNHLYCTFEFSSEMILHCGRWNTSILCNSSHCSVKQRVAFDSLVFKLYLIYCTPLSALEMRSRKNSRLC